MSHDIYTLSLPTYVLEQCYHMQNTAFWDVMSYSLQKIYKCFGDTYILIFRFHWNVGKFLPEYMASRPRTQYQAQCCEYLKCHDDTNMF